MIPFVFPFMAKMFTCNSFGFQDIHKTLTQHFALQMFVSKCKHACLYVCVYAFDYSPQVSSLHHSEFEMTEVLHSLKKCPYKSILVIFLGEEKSRCYLHKAK